jgi:hypothetical protein
MAKWCTVTVTDANGKRYSMDLLAESAFDAAHLYLASAKSQEAAMLPSRGPVPTVATVFEVVADGRVFRVKGSALQRWIIKRRQELGGPAGLLFRQRPGLN